MPTEKAVKEKVKKKAEKKHPEVTQQQLNAIWDVIDKVQKDLNYIGEKVERILNRLGLNI